MDELTIEELEAAAGDPSETADIVQRIIPWAAMSAALEVTT